MFAATLVTVGIAAANGAGVVASTAPSTSGSQPTHDANYERMRVIYDLMNRRAEELRRERNSTSPDTAVVERLKEDLRILSDRL